MAHFGEILAELRRDNNLTQKELANLLNISGSSISAYERGTRLPDISVLELFSDFFNVSTDYLIGKAPYTFKPTEFLEIFHDSVTTGDLLKKLNTLTAHQRHTLLEIINDMQIAARARNTDKKGGLYGTER